MSILSEIDDEVRHEDQQRSRELRNRAIAELNSLDSSDRECNHANADAILAKYVRDSGAPDVADAYDRAGTRVGFWYA